MGGKDWDDEKTIMDAVPGGGGVAPPPPIEVVLDRVTHESGVLLPAGTETPPVRLLEIWTKNRIYLLDSQLVCVSVRDRKTGQEDPKHAVLGTRLVGGQRRYGKTLHITRPLPVPGTEAVFEKKTQKSASGVTSRVERIVVRIQVTSVVMEKEGAWDDVTNSLLNLETIRRIGEGKR